MSEPGTIVELHIERVAHGGICVARLDGRVVFVSDTIPGETVRARLTETRKKSFWRADTVEVLEPSEHRQPHVWAAAALERDPADRAGGAEFGHIALAHQRELKRAVLTESLQRMAKLDAGPAAEVRVEVLPGDDRNRGLGWRTRIRLHVDDEGRIGPMASRSHRVIPVDDVPLATPEVQAATPFADRFPGFPTVDVLAPTVGDARLILGEQAPTAITEQVGDRSFRLDDGGFWQVHREAPATLTRAVQEAIDPALFDPRAQNLDLYGGVGLLAAAVADRFGEGTVITTVEMDERATDYAAENLSEWLGAQAVTGRVDRWVQALDRNAAGPERDRIRRATVVLDPPRSGAGGAVMESLGRLAPAQLIYVACDPVALARDVALAAEHGYELTRLRAFDLFPHTHHIEAVATLTRAP